MPPLTFGRSLHCRIDSTGSAFPQKLPDGATAEFTNQDVIRLLAPLGRRGPRTEQEIQQLADALSSELGVRNRRWAHRVGGPVVPGEATTVDLQVAALRRALQGAQVAASELAAVITSTSTPARVTAGNAPAVAHAVGARCAAFDLRAGCAGGVHALVQGYMLAASSGAPVAVAAADTFSKIVPPTEPLAGLAMADGAGAVILVPADQGSGLLGAALNADGGLGHLGTSPSPFPPTRAALEAGQYYLQGDPVTLAREAPGLYQEVIEAALERAGVPATAVDLMVPHQAGARLIEAVSQRVGIPLERVVSHSQRHANVGAASVLVALHEAMAQGRAVRGQTILLAALGGGLCFGAVVVRL